MRPYCPIDIAGDWWSDITRRYGQPPRAYHNAEHVREVLEHVAWVDALQRWEDRDAVWVAAVLHDVIYEPGRADNEARSADCVPDWCASFGVRVDLQKAQALIRMTADHGTLAGVTGDGALFLDCDMAILGSSPERFALYESQIREEYGFLDDARYAVGRRRFLESALAGVRFHTALFRDRFDAQAVRNLQAALS